MLKLLDLFSGIGGFSLGMEATKQIKTIGFVEKDKFCQKVLRKNFKNVPIDEEIRNVKGSKYTADIISGGFPCQPFSVAGKRRGTEDDRYLWDQTIRVIRECKPRWFIGENVVGIINISEGKVFQQIQKDLEAEGFEVQCLVIPASGFGAWHQRKRVWIIAHSNSNRDRNKITGSNGEEKEIQREHRKKDSTSWKFIRTDTNEDVANSQRMGWQERSKKSKEFKGKAASNKSNNSIEGQSIRKSSLSMDVPNTNSKGSQGHGVSTDMETKQRQVITERSIEEQQTWWEAQSDICRNVNGISYELDKDRKNRIKALGNSIVPLIAYEIAKAILKAEYE